MPDDDRPSGRGAVGALWGGFAAVHLWLTYLGVVLAPRTSFHDVDLYRWWMYQALEQGRWPVLDEPSVYPVGAILPMLVPALGTTVSTVGYALGWALLITVLDAVALAVLLRTTAHPVRAGWWWSAFLALLGPVAIGRLDAVVAPVGVVALALVTRHRRWTAVAATLLTVGAWIKVAPGALVLPLLAAARRPWREVVLPAAAVCVAVVAAVAAGGGLSRVAGFLWTQGDRGLQTEAVGASPWVLASLVRDDVAIRLNQALVTFEVVGPGTATMTRVLDVLFLTGVAAVGAVLLLARRRGVAAQAFLPACLVLVVVLVVANKVGSPQYLSWFAAPVVVLLARGPHGAEPQDGAAPGGRRPGAVTVTAVTALVAAALTQAVFPWGYLDLLSGSAAIAVLLVLRNAVLLVLLAGAVALLRASVRSG